ncbi:unnamed protein product [Clonostachys rosea]|uniref:tRNA(Phe) 7-((3-amino-3-carboxypropyl)-4-demethylwyosine(37)-N(4))-methyltransferase n=1 Tax=Bionectria ochroleuca TaxID=29856 RepID=A0ABY6UF28_BIOOC|nr:unnamed protein product [Clonostachys rosea]
MSCAGRITYMIVPFRKVLWLENLRNPFATDRSLDSWDERLHGLANDLVSMTEIVLDCSHGQNDLHSWKCVLLGRDSTADCLEESVYYALIIRPVIAVGSSEYERVGVGRLRHSQISPQTQDVTII